MGKIDNPRPLKSIFGGCTLKTDKNKKVCVCGMVYYERTRMCITCATKRDQKRRDEAYQKTKSLWIKKERSHSG